ncbi:MAG: efflux RND transporter periplasmic adaptor subunit [Prevotellaceae bacterium]|jgi:HlyD family secretion protein|nr:efflux RND transporter periplasmic adaptor subunit [Prevotellaceae bacterium]
MKKKSKKRVWFIFGAVALIALLIVFGKGGKEELVPVNAEFPVRKTITETIPANGKIQPVVEVKISPDVSGEIVELNVKEGDHVVAGQLLLKIKQDYYLSGRDRAAAQLNAMKAQLSQSEAQYVQTELSFRRTQKLYAQQVVSDADFESAQAKFDIDKRQVEAARYNVKSAEAALKEAEENLVKTTIYAPMAGVVSSLSVERGERVVGTSQMAGTEMLRIANLNEMEVLVEVNENDIIRVKQSDTATIEVDAYPTRKFKGLVTQIANSSKSGASAASADQVTNFEVKIFILPESYSDLLVGAAIPFRPGMSAAVYIQTETHSDVLAVPIQCVTTRTDIVAPASDSAAKASTVAAAPPAAGETYVERIFVIEDGQTVKAVEVTTGIQDNTHIEVTAGLTDSLKVVSGPYNAIAKRLKDGMKVKVSDAPSAP